MELSENVKGNHDILLQKLQLQSGIGRLLKVVNVVLWESMKFLGAFFVKYNSVHGFNVTVAELIPQTRLSTSTGLSRCCRILSAFQKVSEKWESSQPKSMFETHR